MHLVHPPCNHPSDPQECVGRRRCPGCSGSPWDATSVCVWAQCAEQTHGTAVALHRCCTFQHSRGTLGSPCCWGSCPWKQATSLTFPGSCWPDRAFLLLQFYAYTSKPHIQCTECLFMLNKWGASCLHTCSKSLTYTAQLWSALSCDCPRKHQSKEGGTEHNLPPKPKDIK